MSDVLESKRKTSTMQFLETARDLEIYTIKQCAKFPKRYMFLITKEIVALATAVYDNVKSANSVFPQTVAELQIRTNFIIAANCKLQCLLSQLDIAREFIHQNDSNKPLKSTIWQKWVDLITSEAKLLSALKSSDKARYKNLL